MLACGAAFLIVLEGTKISQGEAARAPAPMDDLPGPC
jgi:hypothetical protein